MPHLLRWSALPMIAAAILSLVMLILSSERSLAAASSVECLQSQLNESGFDAGEPDGLLGRRTAAALDSYKAEIGLTSTLPLFTETATAYCRQLGLQDETLKSHWPSKTERFAFHFGDQVRQPLRDIISQSIMKADSEAGARFELELAGTDVVLIGSSPSELKPLINGYVGYKIQDLNARLAENCDSFRRISGFTLPGVMIVCVDPKAILGEEIEIPWTEFMLAHEVIHLYQYQISGVAPMGSSEARELDAEGPKWLQEGLPQAFANSVSTNASNAEYREIIYRKLDGKVPDLTELEGRRALANQLSEVYRAGAVASIDLLQNHGGYPAMAAFMEELGKGAVWSTAFKTAFGLEVADFYATYSK